MPGSSVPLRDTQVCPAFQCAFPCVVQFGTDIKSHVGRADEVIATDKEDLVSRVQEITGAL